MNMYTGAYAPHVHVYMRVFKEPMSWARRPWVQSLALKDKDAVWDSGGHELSARCFSCPPPRPSTMISAQVLTTNIPGAHPDHRWHLDKW